jgi:glycerophosphoryl diester phosphodiesterase
MHRFYTRNALRHPFFTASRPLVFAHRGGAALAPENTVAAFDAGVSAGADGIELDVRLSSDGVPVVHHDSTLQRTTNLHGRVSRMTADEMAAADAGAHFAAGQARPFRARGCGVPRLEEVLRRYVNTRLIIELKDATPALAAAVVEMVRGCDAVERVCIGSFSLRVLRAVRRLDAAIATSAAREEVRWAVYRARLRWPITRAHYGGYQVPEVAGASRVVTPYFVQASRRAGLAVQVWTVNTVADATRLLSWGVDALITDRPDLIVPLVKTAGPPTARA